MRKWPANSPICRLCFWRRLDPEYLTYIVDWFKQWPTEIYRLILRHNTAHFGLYSAFCAVECPTLSNTVHSKSRRRKLFVVGYRFQQTEEWCGREARSPSGFPVLQPNLGTHLVCFQASCITVCITLAGNKPDLLFLSFTWCWLWRVNCWRLESHWQPLTMSWIPDYCRTRCSCYWADKLTGF